MPRCPEGPQGSQLQAFELELDLENYHSSQMADHGWLEMCLNKDTHPKFALRVSDAERMGKHFRRASRPPEFVGRTSTGTTF